jgi:hypothetical protein
MVLLSENPGLKAAQIRGHLSGLKPTAPSEAEANGSLRKALIHTERSSRDFIVISYNEIH